MKNWLTLLLLGLFLSSCKKTEIAEPTLIPVIGFNAVNSTQIKEFKDKIVLTINYQDANGDLGQNDNGVYNCFIKDSRTSIEYKLRIKQLAPEGTTVNIKGKLDLEIPNTNIIANGATQETVIYTIYVTDRAGNKSNEVQSPEITVVR